MQPLNLPSYPFRIRETAGKKEIFDEVRKCFVRLTPEEWVRQHLVMFLHVELHYPMGLIAVERALKINNMVMRFDVAVHDRSGSPVMLAECKAPEVQLSQATLDQAGRYNMQLQVPYMLITNGLHHYCFKIDREKGNWEILDHIPAYEKL